MSIFTTGAHIVPRQLANGRWAWVVAEFDGDTHNDGPIFDTPRGGLGDDDYHQHAEHWGKEFDVEPYAPCMAVYHAQNGHVVMTVQGDSNTAIMVMAEAAEHDGFNVVGRTPQAKLLFLRQLEDTELFKAYMQDIPIGQVYDSVGGEFKAAPVSRDTIHVRLNAEVERNRAHAEQQSETD